MLPSISFTHSALSSLRATLQRTGLTVLPARHARTFASVLPNVSVPTNSASSSSGSKAPSKAKDTRKPGAQRPHLGIEVDPKHGLYAFFRKKVEDDVTKYEALEAPDLSATNSGQWCIFG